MLPTEKMSEKMCAPIGRRMVGRLIVGVVIVLGIHCPPVMARVYFFENITDLPQGPGMGRGAEVNDNGDVAFLNDGAVWFYDRSEGSFLNVTDLPGAPENPFFLKLNNLGNIAIMETQTPTRDYWFFEQSTQTFTNISSLPDFPGNSLAHSARTLFDLNDNNKMSIHSGDNNNGDIYVYDYAAGSFENITDKSGGAYRGRKNEINNLDQVLYSGFPHSYLYDSATDTTTNINTLTGGPGLAFTNRDLNDLGDVALMGTSVAQFYDAATGAFLDVTAAPGWVPDASAYSGSDLSNSREVSFWQEGLFVFDIDTQRFSQLDGFPGAPQLGGKSPNFNSSGQIVWSTGLDVYLATPQPLGDYNNDGLVDGNDLQQFESTYGDTVAIGTAADGDSNRLIDGSDFLVWQRNVGSSVGGSAITNSVVPEPTSFLLAWLAGMVFLLRREKV